MHNVADFAIYALLESRLWSLCSCAGQRFVTTWTEHIDFVHNVDKKNLCRLQMTFVVNRCNANEVYWNFMGKLPLQCKVARLLSHYTALVFRRLLCSSDYTTCCFVIWSADSVVQLVSKLCYVNETKSGKWGVTKCKIIWIWTNGLSCLCSDSFKTWRKKEMTEKWVKECRQKHEEQGLSVPLFLGGK